MASSGPNTNPFGQSGEQYAARWLEQHGCEILHRNWTCSLGEIDLIARHNDDLVFVEVKARRNTDAGHPLEAIGPRKQRQVIRCAKAFLQNGDYVALQPRFDAIGILFDQDPPQLDWVQNAFGVDGC